MLDGRCPANTRLNPANHLNHSAHRPPHQQAAMALAAAPRGLRSSSGRGVDVSCSAGAHSSSCVKFRPCIDIHKVPSAAIAARRPARPAAAMLRRCPAAGQGQADRGLHAQGPLGQQASRPSSQARQPGDGARCPAHPPPLAHRSDAQLKTNFESDLPSSWYSELYKRDGLTGGHAIMLGADDASRWGRSAGPLPRARGRLLRWPTAGAPRLPSPAESHGRAGQRRQPGRPARRPARRPCAQADGVRGAAGVARRAAAGRRRDCGQRQGLPGRGRQPRDRDVLCVQGRAAGGGAAARPGGWMAALGGQWR
jgi:hypothetical protein